MKKLSLILTAALLFASVANAEVVKKEAASTTSTNVETNAKNEKAIVKAKAAKKAKAPAAVDASAEKSAN